MSAITITRPNGSKEVFSSSQKFISYSKGRSVAAQNYVSYIVSSKWRKRRKEHLDRFPFCYCCGRKATQVHHKTYISRGNEKTRHLMSLCKRCHDFIHRYVSKNNLNLWKGTEKACSILRAKYKYAPKNRSSLPFKNRKR